MSPVILYIYIYTVSSFHVYCFGVVVTTGTFHIKIRDVVSIQVCFSCRRRQDDMSPMREPFGKEPILRFDSEFTLL